MILSNPRTKAIIAVVLFSIFGLFGLMYSESVGMYLLGLYVLLLVHTYYSVRCFSALIDPKDQIQKVVDFALVVSYACLGISLGDARTFFLFWVLLFWIAVLKYVLLVGHFLSTYLLRRKLVADLCGLILGGLAVLFSGYDIFIFAAFSVATVYYVFVRPLYVRDVI